MSVGLDTWVQISNYVGDSSWIAWGIASFIGRNLGPQRLYSWEININAVLALIVRFFTKTALILI